MADDCGCVMVIEIVSTLGSDVDNGPGSRSDGAGGEDWRRWGASHRDFELFAQQRGWTRTSKRSVTYGSSGKCLLLMYTAVHGESFALREPQCVRQRYEGFARDAKSVGLAAEGIGPMLKSNVRAGVVDITRG